MTDKDLRKAERLAKIKIPDVPGSNNFGIREIWKDGYAAACAAKREEVDHVRWHWSDERARSAKLADALNVAVESLQEVAYWMDEKANPAWHPDVWSAAQAAQDAVKKLKEYEASRD